MQILTRLRHRPTVNETGGDFTLIVGLGNPGREYVSNRHNVGFQITDRVAAAHQLSFSKVQHQAMIALGRLRDHRVVIAKPQTFMNVSGRAVDRFGHRRAMAMAVMTAMCGVLITSLPAIVAVIAGLAICCTGVFVAQSIASTHIGIAAEHNRALAVGLYVTFYYGGGSLGSALPGYAWDLGGWPACVALFVAVQLTTIAVTMRWWSDSR